MASPEWIFDFPRASVSHLLRYTSDHSLIFLNLSANSDYRANRRHIQRFEQVWMQNKDFNLVVLESWAKSNNPSEVKVKNCLDSLSKWGREHFSSIPRRIEASRMWAALTR